MLLLMLTLKFVLHLSLGYKQLEEIFHLEKICLCKFGQREKRQWAVCYNSPQVLK